MKFIDKNGRFFGKVSILDVVIVLVAVMLICSFVYSRFGKNDSNISVSNEEITFLSEIKVFGVADTELSPFYDTKNIYSSDGDLIGEIISVKKEPTKTKFKTGDGKYIDTVSEGFYDYFIEVKGKGTQSDKGIFASGTVAIIPNNVLNISTKLFTGSAIVLSVEKAV